MFSILKLLLGFVDPIGKITGQIADAIEDYQKAQTDREKIAAEERRRSLEAKRDVLVAESRTPLNSLARALLAAPAGIFLWKTIVVDKVLKMGTTDDLSENLWYYVLLVIGFYFLDSAVMRFRR